MNYLAAEEQNTSIRWQMHSLIHLKDNVNKSSQNSILCYRTK